MRNIILGIVALFFLSACVTNGNIIPDDNYHKFKSIPMNHSGDKKIFIFDSNGVSKQIIVSLVKDKLKNNIKVSSPNLPKPTVKMNEFNSFIDKLAAAGTNKSTNSLVRKSEFKVEFINDNLHVSIIGSENFGKRKGESIILAKYPINIESKGNKLEFSIFEATEILSKSGNVGGRGEIMPLFSNSEAKNIYSNIFKNIAINKIQYEDNKNYYVKELIANYPVDSIYSNFKDRIGFSHPRKLDVGKQFNYKFKLDGFIFKSNIEILPYRNASKIKYGARTFQSISLYSDGTKSIRDYPSQKKLTNYLAKIVNE